MNKRGIGPIVAMTILLFVAFSAGMVVYNWYGSFQNNWNAKVLVSSRGNLEIVGMKYLNANSSVLGLRNYGEGRYFVIDKVLINGVETDLLVDNVVDGLSNIYLNYTSYYGGIYNVKIFTNKGIFDKTVSVYD